MFCFKKKSRLHQYIIQILELAILTFYDIRIVLISNTATYIIDARQPNSVVSTLAGSFRVLLTSARGPFLRHRISSLAEPDTNTVPWTLPKKSIKKHQIM